MENKLLKEIRFLKWYAFTLTTVLVLFIIYSFANKNTRPHYEEIDVERINIVEKDGKLKMVISNKERQHPGMLNGKSFPKRERNAGIMFFNSSGDECGGLTYDGSKKEADMTYSIDQFRNDQIMQLNYTQDGQGEKPKRAYGLRLWDRKDEYPLARLITIIDSLKRLNNDSVYNYQMKQLVDNGAFGSERFFAGKTGSGDVGIFIRDAKGKPRIKLYVDNQNNPRLEFLDENGMTVPAK